MNKEEWSAWIRAAMPESAAPTLPEGAVPGLRPRPAVVLFDVYGTLLAPTLGDLEAQVRDRASRDSFVATARHFGFSQEVGLRWAEDFYRIIEREHAACRAVGISRAEVVIERVWAELLGHSPGGGDGLDPKDVALYRELQANPVTAYAGAADALAWLRRSGVVLGLVSNAQFYTVPILEACLGASLEDLFDPQWIFFSFELGFAKPDPHFFRLVKTRALRSGLTAEQVLVVGNDPENDVEAARTHGLQAVLFEPGAVKPLGEDVIRIANFQTLWQAVAG
ncbi:putative hydrolase of the HAD superfamily [Desulfacinum hydrothermale DSM 13146]|uniref:Putative hydrolase of the HAD superfamily n=1 Tax=Desulfacinum hydrothermale DSM 13146 TaxID=1121390 RepID=A0A1W1XSC4_9BACT|nr:HAD family hydrolase [Desulfacinum hydrothermale]SMC26796.1 putative hydrolase of the HAD superfamily [Desulfacinum hydrothermale DSM 13146]